jgi:hypothetical protein
MASITLCLVHLMRSGCSPAATRALCQVPKYNLAAQTSDAAALPPLRGRPHWCQASNASITCCLFHRRRGGRAPGIPAATMAWPPHRAVCHAASPRSWGILGNAEPEFSQSPLPPSIADSNMLLFPTPTRLFANCHNGASRMHRGPDSAARQCSSAGPVGANLGSQRSLIPSST